MSIRNPDQRVGVFVDVQNLYYSARNLYNARVKFNEVLDSAVGGRRLIRAMAYCIKADMPEEHTFFEALEKSGFEVKMKDLQTFAGGHQKGDWDVGIAMDIIKLMNKLDVVVLCSGDGDFVPLLEYLQMTGQLT
ncbi:MAG TPA: NYN domain-containing protein, partial [Patescibacteria group bacterium]|nr:NYN domain-containing protein [Patescibacteria group bacterium]